MALIKNHGTKLIGGVMTAFGTLLTLDPATLTALLGPKGAGAVVALGGLLTLYRGIQNTAAVSSVQSAQVPPQ